MTDSREALTPDPRALEDARRIIDAEAEAYVGLGRVAEKIAEYSSAAPGIAAARPDAPQQGEGNG